MATRTQRTPNVPSRGSSLVHTTLDYSREPSIARRYLAAGTYHNASRLVAQVYDGTTGKLILGRIVSKTNRHAKHLAAMPLSFHSPFAVPLPGPMKRQRDRAMVIAATRGIDNDITRLLTQASSSGVGPFLHEKPRCLRWQIEGKELQQQVPQLQRVAIHAYKRNMFRQYRFA